MPLVSAWFRKLFQLFSDNSLGQLHRSGDRDEVQDFEHTFQGVTMGGTGFLGGDVQPELGAPNSGRDADLDAIAEYLLSLEPIGRSPHRDDGGTLSEAATRGATFFVGADRAKSADAGCARCHVPETGFVDFTFYDVGSRRPNQERELNNRSPAWHVNTPTLIGVWTTAPFGGVSGFAEEILQVIDDQAERADSGRPHGHPDGLTPRQRLDLAEFLLSIDGNMTAAEVRDARDTPPPRIVRAEPSSLKKIDVWFNETVNADSVEDVGNWRLEEVGGADVPITGAQYSGDGDRVTLTTQLESNKDYRLVPLGTILNAADTATSGVAANALDNSSPNNTVDLSIGSTLTVTFGASAIDNHIISVHDGAMAGPNLSTWNHDAVWLFPVNPNPGVNTGFLRFEWQETFSEETGVESADRILDASFSLDPFIGNAQTIEIRRCLLPWSDSPTGNDWNRSANGAPTWRDYQHPSSRWNSSGAGALGGSGASISDYNGSADLAATVDATIPMAAINERVTFGGGAVTEAFRFWFDNPDVDYGYGLRLTDDATQDTKFFRAEAEEAERGPRLTITYALPPSTPEEVSFRRGDCNGDGSGDLSDPVFLLLFGFASGQAPPCAAACDANADGKITGDVTDALYLLTFLFRGGPPPFAPHPECAPLPPEEALGCAASTDGCTD